MCQPSFPREERHHRAPVGTLREDCIGPSKRYREREAGGTGSMRIDWVVSWYLFRTRSEISRDYPLNLSISLSGGKETNQDSPSNGE